jgi:ABC-type sulfate transport system substrate-binding protein
VDLGWERELPNQSIITNSTVVLFVRPGNPKM